MLMTKSVSQCVATSELRTFLKPLRCRLHCLYLYTYQSIVYLDKFAERAPKSFLSIYQSIHLLSCLQSLKCFSKWFKRKTKVTAAGQIVQDVDRLHRKRGLRRVIKECNIYKDKSSFKHAQNKQVPDSKPTSKRQVSVCLVRETDGSAAWQQAFKNTDMKQAYVQSLLFAVALAAPKTVTNDTELHHSTSVLF